MKPMTLVALLLVVFGVIALAYQGITYTKREKVVDIGPIHATTEKVKTIPIPPMIGAAAVVGGVVLLVASGRRRAL